MSQPNRHLTRQAVFQALFEADFRHNNAEENFKRVTSEVHGDLDERFGKTLLHVIYEHKSEIDAKILEAAPDWPIEKVAKVDKSVLRLAIAELLYKPNKDVPVRVAINEAIELAKKFGSESSKSFVNGVLGTIYRKYIDHDAK